MRRELLVAIRAKRPLWLVHAEPIRDPIDHYIQERPYARSNDESEEGKNVEKDKVGLGKGHRPRDFRLISPKSLEFIIF